MESLKSFLIKLFYVTAVMEILSLGWWLFIPPKYVTPNIFVLPLLMMAISIMVHRNLSQDFEGRFRAFVNRYLLVVTIKLLSLLVLLSAYIMLFPDDSIRFVLTFFVNYFVYSVFDVRLLLHQNRAAK